MHPNSRTVGGLTVRGAMRPGYEEVLTSDALGLVEELVRRFGPRVEELLQRRQQVQARFDRGEKPDFDPGTRQIRESAWTVAPLPQDLLDRRVEITGPVDRKMIINALNSGASVFMADFEDANSTPWDNCVQGQFNLIDAVERTISLDSGEKTYRLNDEVATLLVR